MHRELVRPGPPLSRFIEQLWYYQNEPTSHSKERLMPDGCASLVINLAEEAIRVYDPVDTHKMVRLGRTVFNGPRTECMAIDTDEQVCVLGISFRPGGAAPFLELPTHELCNVCLNLDDLWGRLAEEMRDRVLSAPTPLAKLRVVETVLLQRLSGLWDEQPIVKYAISNIVQAPQTARIAEVVHATGFTSRRFIELFKRHVGMAPKLFCRVRRFQRVLRGITSGRPVSWTDIALDCGYFDQAHFIHDFREFSGVNPTKYLSDHSGFPGHYNHLPIRP
ncbi:MAG TPA: helix-turn-helix domain-containing protein [Terriglobales bacterium]|nr:helix-turn-helix domain-containing protein [Terriglobales bacterium]